MPLAAWLGACGSQINQLRHESIVELPTRRRTRRRRPLRRPPPLPPDCAGRRLGASAAAAARRCATLPASCASRGPTRSSRSCSWCCWPPATGPPGATCSPCCPCPASLPGTSEAGSGFCSQPAAACPPGCLRPLHCASAAACDHSPTTRPAAAAAAPRPSQAHGHRRRAPLPGPLPRSFLLRPRHRDSRQRGSAPRSVPL